MKEIHLDKSQRDKLKNEFKVMVVIRADVDGTGRFPGCDEPEPYKMTSEFGAVYSPCPYSEGEFVKVEKTRGTVVQVRSAKLERCSNGHHWWRMELILTGKKQIYSALC